MVMSLGEYMTEGDINSVYDGDTVSNLVIDMGFNMQHINSFRLWGIDTPELRTRNKTEKIKGYQARTMLRLLIGDKQLAIKSFSKKGTGKYGRILGELYIYNGVNEDAEGNIINTKWMNAGLKLIDCGLAVPYYGGTKVKDWGEDEGEIEDNEVIINRVKEGKDEFIEN
jgi:micrococcal nuclease